MRKLKRWRRQRALAQGEQQETRWWLTGAAGAGASIRASASWPDRDHHRRKGRRLDGCAVALKTGQPAFAELIALGKQLLRPELVTPGHFRDHNTVLKTLGEKARFSSCDNVRHRSTPVITSMRCSRASFVSTLRSTLWSNRSMLIAAHHTHARSSRRGGIAVALTINLSSTRHSEHFEEDGPRLLRHACRIGLEGVVSKVRDAPYRSGRGKAWI